MKRQGWVAAGGIAEHSAGTVLDGAAEQYSSADGACTRSGAHAAAQVSSSVAHYMAADHSEASALSFDRFGTWLETQISGHLSYCSVSYLLKPDVFSS